MLFKTNKENDELIEVLSQIRDNLCIGINAEDLNNVAMNLDKKISDVKKDISDEFKSTSDHVTILSEEIEDIKEAKIQITNDEIFKLKETIELLENKLNTVIKINLDLKNRIRNLEKNEATVESEPNKTAIEKYVEMRKGTYFGRRYTGNIKYDGFNFINIGGAQNGEIKCNILELKDMWDNRENICNDIVNNGVKEKYYAHKYNKSEAIFKRVFFNLIGTDYFRAYLMDLEKSHTYQFRGDYLYIDNRNSGLKVTDVIYIKTCIENTNNKIETIQNFMGYFKNIENNYIRIISCNIEKIPEIMLNRKYEVDVENNPQKRKEQGRV